MTREYESSPEAQDMGASADADRATQQSPSPSVSALRVSIPSAVERKAIAWAAKNMVEGQFADDCPYVRSNVAVWGLLPNYPGACTCREVPRTYAPFLTAQATEARRAETQSGSVHESAVDVVDAPNSSGRNHPTGEER